MGQKVNPHGMRVGVIKDWDSRWYAEKDFADNLVEDHKIREFITKNAWNKETKKLVKTNHNPANISHVEIERKSSSVTVKIYCEKPQNWIDKEADPLTKGLKKIVGKKELRIEFFKENQPSLNAKLTAEYIAQQLEKRVAFRRAMKMAMQNTMKDGALGIKAACSGRLGGADIARAEFHSEGTIPLQTLRADIDYGTAEADTTYGKVGVKVWIYRGEVLPTKNKGEGDK